jgi:hypothetical protein
MYWEEPKKREYTQEELRKYEKYKEEWTFRMMSNRNRFPDWGISNNIGDPFSIDEWIDKSHLHNFKGYNF